MQNESHKNQEANLHTYDALKFYRDFSRVLALANSESDVYDAFCRLVVDVLKCDSAWAAYIIELDGKLVIPASHYGAETDCTSSDVISIRIDDPLCSGIKYSAEHKQVLTLNNLKTIDTREVWHQKLIDNDFQSVCIIPIITSNKVIAVFSALSKRTSFFDKALISFLATACGDLAFSSTAVSEKGKANEVTNKGLIEKFGVLFNNTSDAIFVHEMLDDNIYGGKFTEVNSAACAKLGCQKEELIKCNFEMLNRPCSSVDLDEIKKSILKTGHAHFESRITCGCDISFPVRISSHQFNMDDQKYIISIVRDISEKLRTIKELNLLQNIIENSSVSVVITDKQGRIEYVNPVFEKSTGYTFAEAAGENPRLLKSDMTDQKVFEELWQTISSGKTWKGEFRNKRKNGELYWESAIIFPVRDQYGEVTNYIGVKEDITDKKHLEDQVRHAQRLNIIGEMAGSFAHDLKNIILIIGGFATRLEKKIPQNTTEHEYAIHIMKAVSKAAKLTNGLLTFGRKQPNKPQCIDINLLLSEYLDLVEKITDDKVVVELKLHKGSIPVLADGIQLEQVLMNLASNAKDAMPEGGKLSISSAVINSQSGKIAKIIFEDTGCGMTKEVCSRIFDPFYTTKDPGKGTGLGLSIVYGIIHQHHGEIRCTSTKGVGTKFIITLPVYNNNSVLSFK
jgi:PAS domain S-box-containing protein